MGDCKVGFGGYVLIKYESFDYFDSNGKYYLVMTIVVTIKTIMVIL